jgi:hypothetical protein
MSTPKRIQRKRTKGWKMPPNTVSVTRPGEWGNPFRIGGYFRVNAGAFAWLEARADVAKNDPAFTKIETPEQAVEFFKRYASSRKPGHFKPLHGKDLACWCPLDQPCHADVLLELANKI